MSIGEKIKNYRKENKLTQKQLSSSIGISEISIRKYEAGTRTPSINVLIKIADCLNVPYLELIKDTEFDKMKGKEVIEIPLLEKFDELYPNIKDQLNKVEAINIFLKEKGHDINDFTEEEYKKIEKLVIDYLDTIATIKKNTNNQ